MKVIIAVSILFLVAVSSAVKPKCNTDGYEVPKDFLDMNTGCSNAVREQIQKEIDASIQYLAMGAHFAKDTVNRPGFSEFFFKAAGEEREHATKLIEYLLMRGELTGSVSKLISVTVPPVTSWVTGVDALKDALKRETEVTKSIRGVIEKCENDKTDSNRLTNDYHLVDYLTSDFLEEQYHGQRDLAGKISTLGRMMLNHGALGEFLFDKQLLD